MDGGKIHLEEDMVRIILHGANGRMGRIISGICKEDPDTEIAAGIDTEDLGLDSYPVFTDIMKCDVPADAVIDFSTAKAVDGVLDYCVKRRLPLALCTTGLSEEQLKKVDEAGKKIAVLKSANMSLGINTLFDILQKAAKVLAPAGFDIEIVEKHHNQKLDAPSGTALALADVIREALDQPYEYKYDRSKERKKRDPSEIGISSVRGGTIVGEHDVIFAGTDEVIEIRHTSYSRSVFGKGAVEAAKFLKGRTAGIYDMRKVVEAR